MELEQFTDEELSWLTYHVNDTVIFQNQFENKDTFIVYNREISNYPPIDPGWSPGRECYQPVSGSYKMINRDSSLEVVLSINKDRTLDLHFHKHPSVGDLRTNLRYFIPEDEVTIGETKYRDVYSVSRDTPDSVNKVVSIKFNREFGLLQYQLHDGINWSLYDIMK